MKLIEGIAASTHVDKQYESIALSALQDMTNQQNTAILTVIHEHDPFSRPIGRTIGAEIRRFEDGHHGMFILSQIFENEVDRNTPDLLNRKMVICTDQPKYFSLEYDHTMLETEDGVQLIKKVEELSEDESHYYAKKSLDFIPTVVLQVGTYVLDAACTGAIGWLTIKGLSAGWSKLSEFYAKLEVPLWLQGIRGVRQNDGREYSIKILTVNPTDDDLERFRDAVASNLNQELDNIPIHEERIRSVSFEEVDGKINLISAVRDEGTPWFEDQTSYERQVVDNE